MDDILKRLTDYIAQCPSANGRTFHEMHEEVLIAHSADEIVKLRAALREIIDMHPFKTPDGEASIKGLVDLVFYINLTARRALNTPQERVNKTGET